MVSVGTIYCCNYGHLMLGCELSELSVNTRSISFTFLHLLMYYLEDCYQTEDYAKEEIGRTTCVCNMYYNIEPALAEVLMSFVALTLFLDNDAGTLEFDIRRKLLTVIIL